MQAEKKTPTPPPTTITTTMRTPAAIDDDVFMQEVCDDRIRKDCNVEELDGGESDEGSGMGENVCEYQVERTRNAQDDNDSDPINNERWPDSDTYVHPATPLHNLKTRINALPIKTTTISIRSHLLAMPLQKLMRSINLLLSNPHIPATLQNLIYPPIS
jgi:hypothetical protein